MRKKDLTLSKDSWTVFYAKFFKIEDYLNAVKALIKVLL